MKSQIWNSKILNFGSWLFLITGMVVGSYLLTSGSSKENHTEVAQLHQVSAEPVSTIDSSVGHIPIEDIKVGMRVLARNPEISDEERATWTEPNWADWYHLSLVMPKPDGSELHIEMLRSEEWVRSQLSYSVQLAERAGSDSPSFASCGSWSDTRPSYVLRPLFQDIYSTSALLETAGASIGNLAIQLDLPELGLSGEARVLNIRPNGQVNSGSGEVVTATFHHTSGDIVDLTINTIGGNRESIGTTANHPFWSVDRQAFVPAGDLESEERLKTYSNENQAVVQNTSRGNSEVFNLEVNNEHVYYVGSSGTLVHNNCPAPNTGKTVTFAHGTHVDSAENIVNGGLNAVEAAATSKGGKFSHAGAFDAHPIGPPGKAGPGLQEAYDWSRRHTTNVNQRRILIGEIDESLFLRLKEESVLVVDNLPGVDSPQWRFLPEAFDRVNTNVRWSIINPSK